MAEFLLEFLSEEIPARMQARAAQDLVRLLSKAFDDARLSYDRAEGFVTARRLTAVFDGLPSAQPDQRNERKGPKVGAPEQAIQGFLRSTGLTLDACEKRDTGKGEFYFAVIEKKGQATAALLANIIAAVVGQMPWPKSMRWADKQIRWVRPLHGVLAVFEGKALDGEVAGLRLGNQTVGHRFMAPGKVTVTGFDNYGAKLRSAYVMLDAAERRRTIWEDATRLAGQMDLRVQEDAGLLAEVAGLVEWPVVLMGRIDDAFMAVPPEALSTAMRAHQKYFSVVAADGSLAPHFIFAANMHADDGGKTIVGGNERVLRARLSDAKFFWDQDRKTPLADGVPALDKVVFHAKLGSVGEKIGRMQVLAQELAALITDCDGEMAQRGALLAKADLVSDMVGEFPELQGLMGRYYALEAGEAREVADAIGEHYMPVGPGDDYPTKPESIAVALADKIDTLVGFWAIDQKPTGSKDPYALRRAALGVIRIVLGNGLRLSLNELFTAALALQKLSPLPDEEALAVDLMGFFADRLKVHLRDEGIPHDHVAAIFALGGDGDLVRLVARVKALGQFLGSEDGGNLLTAYRRAANIVRVEEKKDGAVFDGAAYDPDLASGDEAKLWGVLAEIERLADSLAAAEAFGDVMTLFAQLRAPVDDFFTNVTVNVEDGAIRANRLRLLARIVRAMNGMADFSRISG